MQQPPPKKGRHYDAIDDGEAIPSAALPSHSGSLGNPSNWDKGLLYFPVELQTEILECYPKITVLTRVPYEQTTASLLPEEYLDRTDTLRALSQVCVAYRRTYLELLWETVNIYCASHTGSRLSNFYVPAAEALVRKSDGLTTNPDLAKYVRTLNIAGLSRHRSTHVFPKFAVLLQSLPNLHTLHILHINSQVAARFKEPFKNVTIPNIKTLVLQSPCSYVLASCPNVTSLWFTKHYSHKLVPTLEKHCKSLEELRGFDLEEIHVERIFKALPNLRIIDVLFKNYKPVLKHLHKLEKLTTVIVVADYIFPQSSSKHAALQKCIKDVDSLLKSLPEPKELRLLYTDTSENDNGPHDYVPESRYGSLEVYLK